MFFSSRKLAMLNILDSAELIDLIDSLNDMFADPPSIIRNRFFISQKTIRMAMENISYGSTQTHTQAYLLHSNPSAYSALRLFLSDY